MLGHIASYVIIRRVLKAVIALIKKNPQEILIINEYRNYK